MAIKLKNFNPILYNGLFIFGAGISIAALYPFKDSSSGEVPTPVKTNFVIPIKIVERATFESELGLKDSNTSPVSLSWMSVARVGGIFDCFRPIGQYEYTKDHWVVPSAITYRTTQGEHLFSSVVELFYAKRDGTFSFDGVLTNNFTLNYPSYEPGKAMSALRYFKYETNSRWGSCTIPLSVNNTPLPLPVYTSNRYDSLLSQIVKKVQL